MTQRTKQSPEKSLEDVVRELGSYPLAAFEFLHEGLEFTVGRLHGPISPGLQKVLEWLNEHGADLSDLTDLAAGGKTPPVVQAFVAACQDVGTAIQKLNRHVSGEELSWGLRDLALQKWGYLATTVLGRWGIRSTRDFGRMVFALVNNGLMQKQPHDTEADFDDVFDFGQTFDRSYKIDLTARDQAAEKAE